METNQAVNHVCFLVVYRKDISKYYLLLPSLWKNEIFYALIGSVSSFHPPAILNSATANFKKPKHNFFLYLLSNNKLLEKSRLTRVLLSFLEFIIQKEMSSPDIYELGQAPITAHSFNKDRKYLLIDQLFFFISRK